VGQHDNPENRRAHFETTGPEIWRDTEGRCAPLCLAREPLHRGQLIVCVLCDSGERYLSVAGLFTE